MPGEMEMHTFCMLSVTLLGNQKKRNTLSIHIPMITEIKATTYRCSPLFESKTLQNINPTCTLNLDSAYIYYILHHHSKLNN